MQLEKQKSNHKTTDKLTRKKSNPPLSAAGFSRLGDEAPLIKIKNKKQKTNQQTRYKNKNVLKRENNLRIIQEAFLEEWISSPPIISRHPCSLLVTHLMTNLASPVAIIQSTKGFSHFHFPRSWPDEAGRFLIFPFSSRRSEISFRALSSFGCVHFRKRVYCPHPPAFVRNPSSRFCQTRLRYDAQSQ
jgi:hypothetical protein